MSSTSALPNPLRVAIVGAGPAGIYAGNILKTQVLEAGGTVQLDLFESLPAPYGLIRYGVAPDHPRIKGIVNSLHEMLSDGAIRLIGNVHIGRDLTVAELRERYHAVILATGAVRDAALRIPGVELEGSYGAADFVSWYDGHPDVPREWPLEAEQLAVIGNGNVALDVARMLAKLPDNLLPTDIPDNVYKGLSASPVREVHVFGRRGPADIKFTPIELRELGEVAGVDVVLDERDFEGLDPAQAANNQIKVMLRVFDEWRRRERTDATRVLHLHFFHTPAEIVGDEAGRVSGIRFTRTPGAPGAADAVPEYPVQAVYRAVGYFGSAVDGVPFDEIHGVIPNAGGRILDGIHSVPGMYATGWIKRGPVGLIGHTKGDALETIENLMSDAAAGDLPEPGFAADAALELLDERGVEYTTWSGWLTLDAHERALGEVDAHPRERVKVVPRDEQVAISRSAEPALGASTAGVAIS